MAAETGTYITTGASAAVGQREDLTDLISNISYTETPFLSSLGRVQAKGITHDWQTDTLRAPGANAVNEGNEPTFAIPARTTRVNNTCQILQEDVIVSGTLDTVDKAGRRTELAYQMQKKMKEIARDLELALLLETENTSDPRRMFGLEAHLNGGTNEVDGTAAPLVTVTVLDTAMENIWDVAGGHPDYRALMSGTQKKAVSALTGNTATALNIDFKEKKLINTITVYESDFGMILCVPHQMIGKNQTGIRGGAGLNMSAANGDQVFIYRPDLFKLATLRPTKVDPLAKTGDANKRLITMELTLEARNESGNARIYNLDA